jgi:Bifunctional DNA primase/polymerase, N-terminal/AAA domain
MDWLIQNYENCSHDEDVRSPRHRAALELANQGIPVVPLGVGSKIPITKHGFRDRSADIEQIDKWWGEADYNLGVCPADMSCVALDLDHYKPDGVSQAILDMLPPTRAHASPQGGEHRLYKSDVFYGNLKFAVNADLRDENGYICWPGSVVDGVEYTIIDAREPVPLPTSLAATLQRRTAEQEAVACPDIGFDFDPEGAAAYVSHIAETGEHPGRYKLAAALVRNFGLTDKTATELCAEYELRTEPSHAGGTPWHATLLHVRKYGQGELGGGVAWQPPGPRTELSPGMKAYLASNVAPLDAARKRSHPTTSRFERRLPSDDAIAPPLEYFDKTKILPMHPSVGFVYGKQGTHKTGLIIKLGLDAIEQHVARVLFLAQEGAYGFKVARLPAARKARGMSWDTLNANWCTVTETFNLLRPEDREALWQAYREFAPKLIFVDVLTKVALGIDINGPEGAQRVINASYELAERFQCPVVFVHHPGKDDTRGMMGNYLLEALADFVWKVSSVGGKVRVHVDKLKDGEADRAVWFDIDISRQVPVIKDSTGTQPRRIDPVAEDIRVIMRDAKSELELNAVVQQLRDRGLATGLADDDPKRAAYIKNLVKDGELADIAIVKQGKTKNGDRYWFRPLQSAATAGSPSWRTG